jgi:HKD family nuclease
MRTSLLNQPDDCQLAARLNELLEKPEFSKFEALVGFAVSSGVRQLQPRLEGLLVRNGTIRIIVGVSNKVTTVEGLQLLLELAHKGARVFVFHNDNQANPIFHPKLYLCEGKDRAVLIVGSNNLTGKGLASNYEISLMQDLDLKNQADVQLIESAGKIIDRYCDVAGGFSHILDDKFLLELQAEGYLGSELLGTNQPETSGEADSTTVTTAARKKLFASKAVPQPAIPKPVGVKPPAPRTTAGVAAKTAAPAGRGPILWEKKLAKSDVQSQTGHPTGVVRLTQAKWRVDGELINWITYFRRELFGRFPWRTAKNHPFVEETDVAFDITVSRVTLGVRRLRISDKPSGEAGQGNYTSSLHWGDLAEDIRKAKLAGKHLRLYGPAAGTSEPFFIEIA